MTEPKITICRQFWFPNHKWNQWEDDATGSLTDGGTRIGHYIIQKRRCSICNKRQIKRLDCY